jgi:hypothetical protein
MNELEISMRSLADSITNKKETEGAYLPFLLFSCEVAQALITQAITILGLNRRSLLVGQGDRCTVASRNITIATALEY